MTDAAAPVDPDLDGRPLQDLWKINCFGCGALNERGLQIKSHWVGDQLVCRWRAQPFHIGPPGFVYGGTIASVVDCHAVWAAVARACRDSGHDLRSGPPPFAYVTGRLVIDYLRPVAVDEDLELHARVQQMHARKALVDCQVLQRGEVCVKAEIVAVRVPMAG